MAELFAKVQLLVEPRLGERAGHSLVAAVMALDDAARVDDVLAPAVPEATAHV